MFRYADYDLHDADIAASYDLHLAASADAFATWRYTRVYRGGLHQDYNTWWRSSSTAPVQFGSTDDSRRYKTELWHVVLGALVEAP